jgi:protein TonB
MNVLFRTVLSLTFVGVFTGCASQPPNPAAPPLPELAVLEDEPVVRASLEVPEVVPTLDPAPWRSTMEYLRKAPTFTPYTKQPEITNKGEVAAALRREYPPLLRDAGVGGTSHVWFFLNAEGRLDKVQLNRSSGRRELDDAALRVASVIQFTPAINHDELVPAWISLPISFVSSGG